MPNRLADCTGVVPIAIVSIADSQRAEKQRGRLSLPLRQSECSRSGTVGGLYELTVLAIRVVYITIGTHGGWRKQWPTDGKLQHAHKHAQD